MYFDLYQWIGFLGMGCIVWGYYLIQSQRTSYDNWGYLWLNLIGAILLIISLIVHFNFGSFMIEVFWIAITLFSMRKTWKKKR